MSNEQEHEEAVVETTSNEDFSFAAESSKDDLAAMMNIGGIKQEDGVDADSTPEPETPPPTETLAEVDGVSVVLDPPPAKESNEDAAPEGADPAPDPNQALLDRIAALEEKLAEKVTAEEAEVPKITDKDGIYQLFGADADPYELTSTPEGLNLFSTKVINASVELALRYSMPVIQAETARIQAVHTFANEFYRANTDLREHNATVSQVVEEIIKKKPETKPQDLFTLAAAEARKRLKLPEPTRAAAPKAPKPAGFANVSASVPGASPTGQPKNALRDDLAAMAKAKG